MQVLKLSDVHKTDNSLRARLVQLIDVVDSTQFETQLFKVMHDMLRCEHLTAFANGGVAPPRIVLATGVGNASGTRPLANKYVANYWYLDPVNRAPPSCLQGERFAMRMVPEIDIDDPVYRHECYTQPQLVERFTLMQRRNENIYRLSFFAGPRDRFPAPVIDQVIESSDLLMSLVMKNDAASESKVPPTFADRLRVIAPTIPPREAEVCTAIMLGMTSEAIAAKLGISINTVLTYRKRAYNRLNISCQNELMRLVLG